MSLSSYLVQRVIATGGYAKVCQAVDLRTNQCVALKYIDKERDGDPHHLDDVRSEVDIFSSLSHAHICKFHEVVETPTQVVIAMELLGGGTLLEYVNGHELGEQDARRFFGQLLSALAYLAEQRVCHRDLRLDNICLDNRRNVKVIDFGFGHRCDPAAPHMDVLCGCPEYCAPEMLRGEPYLASVDVWSAGVILYAMAAGALPFFGETREETAHLVLTQQPAFPPALSPALADLLARVLAKDPAARLSLAEIAAHPWMHAQEGAPSGAARGAPLPAAQTPPRGWWARLKAKFKGKRKGA
jgi:serine/threonine protein kinase